MLKIRDAKCSKKVRLISENLIAFKCYIFNYLGTLWSLVWLLWSNKYLVFNDVVFFCQTTKKKNYDNLIVKKAYYTFFCDALYTYSTIIMVFCLKNFVVQFYSQDDHLKILSYPFNNVKYQNWAWTCSSMCLYIYSCTGYPQIRAC